MIKPAVRTSLYEEVIKQIVDMIKRGEWTPGERIPTENDLAKEFGVSRNCMREALKALANSGIVFSMPRRGTFLSPQALKNVYAMETLWQGDYNASFGELMETRLMIEPQMAYVAAERATDREIEDLGEMVEKAKDAFASGKSTLEFGFEFHRIIALATKNRILFKLVLSINRELKAERLTLLVVEDKEQLWRELLEHELIYNHIKSRQPEQARDVMRQHLETAKRILSAKIEGK